MSRTSARTKRAQATIEQLRDDDNEIAKLFAVLTAHHGWPRGDQLRYERLIDLPAIAGRIDELLEPVRELQRQIKARTAI